MLGVIVKLAQPPDSGGLGRDTYGTRAHGLRALYELLEELEVPTERALVPPSTALGDDVCLVLWAPDPRMVRTEPAHLHQVARWVRGGGRAIVAPSYGSGAPPSGRALPGELCPETTVLAELGLPGVSIESDDAPAREEADGSPGAGEAEGPLLPFLPKRRSAQYRARRVHAEGELSGMGGIVSSLKTPAQGLRVIARPSEPPPDGRLTIRDGDDAARDVVALYRVGRGEVVVVSDAALFLNRCIAEEDNAVLAVNLLGRFGARVVFDEFYHGLTVRGNPVWLLTRHPYGLFVALLLAATGLWIWRASVRLGPPVPARACERRSIGEYVDAMAHLFHRSGHRRFVLDELRRGVLWSLRRKLHLSPRLEDAESVARAMERRHPDAAARLRSSVQKARELIRARREPAMGPVVEAAREMTRCL
jgi:hypothetical protein